jgi:hypothetical protein
MAETYHCRPRLYWSSLDLAPANANIVRLRYGTGRSSSSAQSSPEPSAIDSKKRKLAFVSKPKVGFWKGGQYPYVKTACKEDGSQHGHPSDHHNQVRRDRIVSGSDVRTTVMLRNIPNKMDWISLRARLCCFCH